MNLCTFSGRVGRDPELRHMPNGDPVLGWSLAVDTGTRDKPTTMWLDCQMFGKRAEAIEQYIAKGMKLVVSGRLAQQQYQANDGTTKTALRLSVDQLELPPRGEAAPEEAAAAPTRAPARATAPRRQTQAEQDARAIAERRERERAAKPKSGTGFDDMADDTPF